MIKHDIFRDLKTDQVSFCTVDMTGVYGWPVQSFYKPDMTDANHCYILIVWYILFTRKQARSYEQVQIMSSPNLIYGMAETMKTSYY